MKQKTESTIRFIQNHMIGFNETLAYIGCLSLLLLLPDLAVPFTNQILVDNVLSGLNPEWAIPLLGVALMLTFFKIILRFMEGNAWKHRLMMTTSSTSEMFWHLLRLPVGFFHTRYTADLANRIFYGSKISEKVIDIVLVFLDVFRLVFYVYFMIRYSATLAVFAVIHIVLNLILLRTVHSKQVASIRELQKETDLLQGFTSATIENMDAIKSSTAESFFFQTWGRNFAKMQNASISSTEKNVLSETIPLFLDSIIKVIVLGAGAYYIMEGQLTVGMLMTFETFMRSSMNPMNHIVSNFQGVATVKAQTERMKEVLDESCDVPSEIGNGKTSAGGTKLVGNIELRNVTFGYDRTQPPLIENFNLTIPAGKSVAFVGPSGCGKSTIAKLVSGLYKPWEGEILFDGKPQEEIDRDVFANSVAIVDQNIVMFEGDVSDNVKLWDESIEDFAMIFACHDAQIHEEIVVREGGYHARMESGGKNFSGGQRQRIELASAFAKEPSIMIMDEGTSALDAVTEAKVMDSIKDMGCSQIIIAHRLSTIRDCDEIVVMKHGHVIERGTHQELLDAKGFYSLLIENK